MFLATNGRLDLGHHLKVVKSWLILVGSSSHRPIPKCMNVYRQFGDFEYDCVQFAITPIV